MYRDDIEEHTNELENLVQKIFEETRLSAFVMTFGSIYGLLLIGFLDLIFSGEVIRLIMSTAYLYFMWNYTKNVAQSVYSDNRLFKAIILLTTLYSFTQGGDITFGLIIITLSTIYFENTKIWLKRLVQSQSRPMASTTQTVDYEQLSNMKEYLRDRIQWNRLNLGITAFLAVTTYILTFAVNDTWISDVLEIAGTVLFILVMVYYVRSLPAPPDEDYGVLTN